MDSEIIGKFVLILVLEISRNLWHRLLGIINVSCVMLIWLVVLCYFENRYD